MPAVLPSTPLARPDDRILELPGLLFSTFWSICNYCWSFWGRLKKCFFGIAPKRPKSEDKSNLGGSCRHFGLKRQYL